MAVELLGDGDGLQGRYGKPKPAGLIQQYGLTGSFLHQEPRNNTLENSFCPIKGTDNCSVSTEITTELALWGNQEQESETNFLCVPNVQDYSLEHVSRISSNGDAQNGTGYVNSYKKLLANLFPVLSVLHFLEVPYS